MPNSNYAVWGGRAFIVVAMLIVFASIFGYGRYIRFQNRVEELKANGELVAIEDLCHKVDLQEDDARFYLRKVYEAAKEVNHELSLKEEQDEFAAASRTDPEAMAMFERFTSKYPDLFPTITLAAAAPEMSFEPNLEPEKGGQGDSEGLVISHLSTEVMSIQKVLRVLVWKCDVQIAQGDFDGAFDSAIELMRIGKLNTQHGDLLNTLLGVAFHHSAFFRLAQVSEQQSLSAEKLKVVYSLIDQNDFTEDYRRCLRFERAISTYGMINFDGNRETNFKNEALVWLSTRFKFGPAMMIGNEYLNSMEVAITLSKLPLSNQFTVQPTGSFSLLKSFGEDPVLGFTSIRKSIGRKIAESHALQIVLALDANPSSVDRDDWPAEYLISIGVPEAATIDPFDDQPMRIKRSNGQWNVYSCGRDQNDDGGIKVSDCGVSSMYRN